MSVPEPIARLGITHITSNRREDERVVIPKLGLFWLVHEAMQVMETKRQAAAVPAAARRIIRPEKGAVSWE